MTQGRATDQGSSRTKSIGGHRATVPPGGRSSRRKPSQLRARQTFEVILGGAAALLEREEALGYTTNRIAERAGVSIGTLYQYFSNKDAITLALIAREASELAIEVRQALSGEDARQALRRLIAVAARYQLHRPHFARRLDDEEERLSLERPAAGRAKEAIELVAEFLGGRYGAPASSTWSLASDVMEIIRSLTDAAGRRNERDTARLGHAIEGAVAGYLDAQGLRL